MDDESTVVDEQSAVESETTTPSTSETETTSETEPSPETTSESPATEEQPRAQARIQQLLKEKKELEEKASYWDALNAQAPVAPAEEQTEYLTADQVADAVLRKQQAIQIEQTKGQAQNAMQQDALEALTAHPDLETDDELADMVVALAERNKISFRAAADRVKSRMNQEQKKAEKLTTAEAANKAGAGAPSGARVSNGTMPAPSLTNMSEEEKEANWGTIIANMGGG